MKKTTTHTPSISSETARIISYWISEHVRLPAPWMGWKCSPSIENAYGAFLAMCSYPPTPLADFLTYMRDRGYRIRAGKIFIFIGCD